MFSLSIHKGYELHQNKKIHLSAHAGLQSQSSELNAQRKFGCSSLINITSACECYLKLRVGDTANFGIDSIPSNYRVSIADTDTNTFYLKIPDH